MKFKEKYTCESEKTRPENKKKIVLSEDTYARCMVIQELIDKIEHVRGDLR